jgi:hypothetical protein
MSILEEISEEIPGFTPFFALFRATQGVIPSKFYRLAKSMMDLGNY